MDRIASLPGDKAALGRKYTAAFGVVLAAAAATPSSGSSSNGTSSSNSSSNNPSHSSSGLTWQDPEADSFWGQACLAMALSQVDPTGPVLHHLAASSQPQGPGQPSLLAALHQLLLAGWNLLERVLADHNMSGLTCGSLVLDMPMDLVKVSLQAFLPEVHKAVLRSPQYAAWLREELEQVKGLATPPGPAAGVLILLLQRCKESAGVGGALLWEEHAASCPQLLQALWKAVAAVYDDAKVREG